METLQIEFQPNVKEKILAFLNSFSKNEVKITQEDPTFEETKQLLNKRLEDLRAGKSELISIEEYEIMLDKSLA
jgi:hypothetical protein